MEKERLCQSQRESALVTRLLINEVDGGAKDAKKEKKKLLVKGLGDRIAAIDHIRPDRGDPPFIS